MDAAAEQLVLDYLHRLEDAARRRLGPAEQTAFMARSRAALARQIGETRTTEDDQVRRLLRRFGDPDRLVARERHRLDRQDPGPDGAGLTPGPDDAGPAQDADGTAIRPGQDGAGPPPGGAGRPPAPAPPATRPRSRQDVAATTGRQPAAAPALRPGQDPPTGPGQAAVGHVAADHAAEPPPGLHLTSRWSHVPPRPAPAGSPGPARRSGSGWDDGPDPVDDDWEADDDWDLAEEEPGAGGRGWLSGVLAVVREHPLECAAIVLIGLGGLIAPWPLWPIGVLAMLVSPLWDVRDKLAAVAIPLAVALAGAIAAAGFSAHPPGMSGYAHEIRVEGWNLLRAGAVVGAVYLARRMQRGRRPRREPPWRRMPPG